MLLKNIACNITRLRSAKNLSQKDLAEELFVTHQAVSKWENGKSAPSLDVLVLITKFFRVTIDELISECNGDIDFKVMLNDFERDYCITSIINGTAKYNLEDVFFLLKETERERIIISVLNNEHEIEVLELWPLLSLKERKIFLKGLLRNKQDDEIYNLRKLLRTDELRMTKNYNKENIYES